MDPLEELHKRLLADNLYRSDFKTFQAKFSTPEGQTRLYKYLQKKQKISKTEEQFKSKFFPAQTETISGPENGPISGPEKKNGGNTLQTSDSETLSTSKNDFIWSDSHNPNEVKISNPNEVVESAVVSQSEDEGNKLKYNRRRDITGFSRDRSVQDIAANPEGLYNDYMATKSPKFIETRKAKAEQDPVYRAKNEYKALQFANETLNGRLEDLKGEIAVKYGKDFMEIYLEAGDTPEVQRELLDKVPELQELAQYQSAFQTNQKQFETYLDRPDNQEAKAIFDDYEARQVELDRQWREEWSAPEKAAYSIMRSVDRAGLEMFAGLAGLMRNVDNAFTIGDQNEYDFYEKWADKADNYVEGFLGRHPKPTHLQRGLFERVSNYGDHTLVFDKDKNITAVRDKQGFLVDNDTARAVAKEYQSDPNPTKIEESSNWYTLMDKTTDVLADMALQIKVGSMIKAPLSKAGVSNNLAANIGVVTAITAQTANNYRKEGLKAGMDEGQAAAYAMTAAPVVAMVSLLNPLEARLAGGTSKGFLDKITNTFTPKLTSGQVKSLGASGAAKLSIKDGVGAFLREGGSAFKQGVATGFKQGVMEGIEESLIEPAAEKLTQYIYNKTANFAFNNQNKFDTSIDLLEMKEQFILGFMPGATLSVLQRDNADYENEALLKAARNPLLFKKLLNSQLQAGIITEEEAAKATARVEHVNRSVGTLDFLDSEDTQRKVIELLDKQRLLKFHINNSGKDLTQPMQHRLAQIESQLAEIGNNNFSKAPPAPKGSDKIQERLPGEGRPEEELPEFELQEDPIDDRGEIAYEHGKQTVFRRSDGVLEVWAGNKLLDKDDHKAKAALKSLSNMNRAASAEFVTANGTFAEMKFGEIKFVNQKGDYIKATPKLKKQYQEFAFEKWKKNQNYFDPKQDGYSQRVADESVNPIEIARAFESIKRISTSKAMQQAMKDVKITKDSFERYSNTHELGPIKQNQLTTDPSEGVDIDELATQFVSIGMFENETLARDAIIDFAKSSAKKNVANPLKRKLKARFKEVTGLDLSRPIIKKAMEHDPDSKVFEGKKVRKKGYISRVTQTENWRTTEEAKEELLKDPYYEVEGHKEAAKQVEQLIDFAKQAFGDEGMVVLHDDLMNGRDGLEGAAQAFLAVELADYWAKQGNTAKQVEANNFIDKKGRFGGRFINALGSNAHPKSIMRRLRFDAAQVKKEVLDHQVRADGRNTRESLKDLVQDARLKDAEIKEALETERVRKIIEEAKKPEVTLRKGSVKAKRVGLKNDLKAALKALSDPDINTDFSAGLPIDPDKLGDVVNAARKLAVNYVQEGVLTLKEIFDSLTDTLKQSVGHAKALEIIDKIRGEVRQAHTRANKTIIPDDVIEDPAFTEKLQKVAKQHLTNPTHERLRDAILAIEGFNKDDVKYANKLEFVVMDEVKRVAYDRQKKALQNFMSNSGNDIVKRRRKTVGEKLIDLINSGVHNEEVLADSIGDYLGIPVLDKNAMIALEALSEAIDAYQHDKEMRERKLKEFNSQIEEIQGFTKNYILGWVRELFYIGTLSTTRTTERAFLGAALTAAEKIAIKSITNPVFAARYFAQVMGTMFQKPGTKNQGVRERTGNLMKTWYSVVKDGHSDVDYFDKHVGSTGKVDKMVNTKLAELSAIKKLGKLGTYSLVKVYRLMLANDAVKMYGLKEFHSSLKTYNNLLAENGGNHLKVTMKKLNEKTFNTKTDHVWAKQQAYTDAALIRSRGDNVPTGYIGRRINTLLALRRGKDVSEYAQQQAREALLTNDPVGFLGQVYKQMAALGELKDTDTAFHSFGKMILTGLVPFKKTISNFANLTLDYSFGLIRAIKGTRWDSKGKMYNLTGEERMEHLARGTIGVGLSALMFSLMLDHDEEKDQVFLKKDFPIKFRGQGFGGPSKFFDNKSIDENFKEWSWSFDNGETWWKFNDSPIAAIFAPLAVVSDFANYKPDKPLDGGILYNAISSYGTYSMAFALDQSYMQAIGDLQNIFNYVKDGKPEKASDLASKMAIRPIKSTLYGGLYKQIFTGYKALYNIPEKSKLRTSQDDSMMKHKSILDALAKDVPFVENYMYDAVDFFGYPNVREFKIPLLPYFVSNGIKDAVSQKLEKPAWKAIWAHNKKNVGNPIKIKPIEITKHPVNGRDLTRDEIVLASAKAAKEWGRLVARQSSLIIRSKPDMAKQIVQMHKESAILSVTKHLKN